MGRGECETLLMKWFLKIELPVEVIFVTIFRILLLFYGNIILFIYLIMIVLD